MLIAADAAVIFFLLRHFATDRRPLIFIAFSLLLPSDAAILLIFSPAAHYCLADYATLILPLMLPLLH